MAPAGAESIIQWNPAKIAEFGAVPPQHHSGKPGQTLWQIRGSKRVYVYPNKPPLLAQAALEKKAIRETGEYMAYEKCFDDAAAAFDLQPGQMLDWPKLGLAAAYNFTGNVRKRARLNIDFAVDSNATQGVRTILADEMQN